MTALRSLPKNVIDGFFPIHLLAASTLHVKRTPFFWWNYFTTAWPCVTFVHGITPWPNTAIHPRKLLLSAFWPPKAPTKKTQVTRWLINVDDIPNCSRLIRSIYNGPKLESIDLKWFLNMDISRFQLQQSCGVEAPVYFTGFLVTLLKRSFMWNTTSSRLEKVQCSEESFALIQQKIHIARRLMYIKKKYRMSLHPKLCQSHPSFQSRTWVRDAFMWASKGVFPNAVGCLSFLLLWLAKDTSKLKSLRSWPSKRLKISSGSWVWEAWQKKKRHHNQGSGQGG